MHGHETRLLFLLFNHIKGWHRIDVTDSRTAENWVNENRKLVNEDYPDAIRITLVIHNLNTHVGVSLYKV